MSDKLRFKLIILFFATLVTGAATGRAQVVGVSDTLIIDRVIAVVGNRPVTQYDLEARFLQALMGGERMTEDLKCQLFEELLINKLLVIQAEIDSVEVSDDEVNRMIDAKLQMEVLRLGSQENLENLYKKSLVAIRKDLFESAKEQELVKKMYKQVTDNVTITPSEVQKFFRKIPQAQIPLRPETVELRQIVMKARIGEEERTRIINRLNEFRDRITAGENMKNLAVLYSDDPGTATRGGELGLASRSDLDPAYSAAAFNLKNSTDVSRPFRSEFGYHIVQTIERRGDLINTRHILLQPKPTIEEKIRVRMRLDSVAQRIRLNEFTFDQAVASYSEDEQTANNYGILTDVDSNQPKIELTKLPTNMMVAIRNLKVGEISDPFESLDDKGSIVYKIVLLKSRNPAHRADLKTDYDFIQNFALQEKKTESFAEWVDKKIISTFHRIDPDFKSCEFDHQAWNK